ncbi:MAG: hypothetical protein E7645_08395 [Ruminococcaceae bacterium]|nr:hypothetical protein [Oscillospiraceae bacterium]
MKKLLLFLSLLLLVLLTVVACNDTTVDPPASPSASATEAPAEEPTGDPTEAPTEIRTEAPTVPPEYLTYVETEKVIEIPTEAPTEAPTEPEFAGDPTQPVTVLGVDKLTSTQGIYNLDDGIVDNGDYVTIDPTGEDPYYYPAYNFLGARYIIIKYRTANCDGVYMQVYLSSSGTGPQDDSTMLQGTLVGDGNWQYLVIDTKPLMDAGKYNGKTVSYLRFDPLDPGYLLDENGNIVTNGSDKLRNVLPENAQIDVAYIAFCHAPNTMQNLESES